MGGQKHCYLQLEKDIARMQRINTILILIFENISSLVEIHELENILEPTYKGRSNSMASFIWKKKNQIRYLRST